MSLDAAITAKPARLEGKPLLFFLTLLAALGMLATNMYLASFPSLGKELAATPAQVKLTLTVFLLGFAGGQLIVGPLSDRYGRRPLLLAGLVVYAATGVFIALSVPPVYYIQPPGIPEAKLQRIKLEVVQEETPTAAAEPEQPVASTFLTDNYDMKFTIKAYYADEGTLAPEGDSKKDKAKGAEGEV